MVRANMATSVLTPEATSLSSTVTCDSYKQMFWR